MKLATGIIAVFVLLPAISHADDWTNTDTAWQLTYAAFHIADWGQTLDLAESFNIGSMTANDYTHQWEECAYKEGNPFLGDRPTRSEVNTYFATTLILHTTVAYYLPPKYRRVWQAVWIGIEAGVVARNARIGVSFSF